MKKETATDYLDYLLQIWAYWEIKLKSGEAGWSTTSAAIAALEQGSDFKTKQFVSKMPPFNEVADHMQILINQYLKKDFPNAAHAIKTVYLHPELKQEQVAFQCNISCRTLAHRLFEGKIYLKGCISLDPFFKDY